MAFLTPRFWPSWLGLAVLRLTLICPRKWVDTLGAQLGKLYFKLNKKRRKIMMINLRMAFPEKSDAEREMLARRHFVVAIQTLLDSAILWWGSDKRLQKYIHVDGIENYQHAIDHNKNVILLTGHFIGLEFGGTMVSKHFPHIGLIKPLRNPLINWYVAKGRTRYDALLYLRSDGMRPVIKAIKSGHGFYYLPDEDHGIDKSVFVDFFATKAAMIKGVAKLVRLCDAVALPAYVRRIDGKQGYQLVIKPALKDFPCGDEQQDAQRVATSLEENIREYPEQYMWTYRLFNTRPGGEKTPYERPRDKRRAKLAETQRQQKP